MGHRDRVRLRLRCHLRLVHLEILRGWLLLLLLQVAPC